MRAETEVYTYDIHKKWMILSLNILINKILIGKESMQNRESCQKNALVSMRGTTPKYMLSIFFCQQFDTFFVDSRLIHSLFVEFEHWSLECLSLAPALCVINCYYRCILKNVDLVVKYEKRLHISMQVPLISRV